MSVEERRSSHQVSPHLMNFLKNAHTHIFTIYVYVAGTSWYNVSGGPFVCFGVYRRGWCLSSPVCPSTVQSTPLTIAFLALGHAFDLALTLTRTVVGALREVLLACIRPPLVCPISLLVVNLRRLARQICKLAPDPSGRQSRPANQVRLPATVQKGIEAAQASSESGATLPTGQPEGQTARQRPDQPASPDGHAANHPIQPPRGLCSQMFSSLSVSPPLTA